MKNAPGKWQLKVLPCRSREHSRDVRPSRSPAPALAGLAVAGLPRWARGAPSSSVVLPIPELIEARNGEPVMLSSRRTREISNDEETRRGGGGAGRAVRCGATAQQASSLYRDHQVHAGLPARRQRRHHCPHPRTRDGEEPRPVDRGRGQARAGRGARGRDDRAQRSGRLFAAGAAERAPGLCGTVEERQIQGGGRFHLDIGRKLLSVHDLREGGFALQDTAATDRRGARQARRH